MNKENETTNFDEIQPKLRFDAFTGGIKNGGLRSVSSINMLVCYIVANINGRVTAQNIIETVAEGEIANHFEITEAIARLKSNNVIAENEDGSLTLLKGNNEIDLIEHDLPLTIRDSSIRICQKIIAREQFKRDNKAEIVECENGYQLTLTVSDISNDFMKLTLYAPTIEQAELIKAKFITNPIKVYETLIDSIFENDY